MIVGVNESSGAKFKVLSQLATAKTDKIKRMFLYLLF
jgi:hypothetical protein